MATKIGDMAVYISANTAGLARDLTRASHMAGSFAGRLTRQMTSLGGSMRSSLGDVFKVAGGNLLSAGIQQAATSMKGLVADSIRLAAAAEATEGRFSALLGGTGAAKKLMGDLRSFAAASPLSLEASTAGATRLLAAGTGRDQITPTLRALNDISMGDSAVTDRMLTAYAQVKATGRLQGDEWNQIANAGTLSLKDLAKTMKADEDQMKAMIEAGKVGFSDLQRTIKEATEAGGRFYGMGDKYAKSFAGRLDKLDDGWQDLKKSFGEALIQEWGLADAADDMDTFMVRVKDYINDLRPTLKAIGDFGKGLVQVFAESGRSIALIAGAASDIFSTRFPQSIKGFKDDIAGLQNFKLDPLRVVNFGVSLAEGIADAIEAVRPVWRSFVDDFVVPIKDAIADIGNLQTNVKNKVAQGGDLGVGLVAGGLASQYGDGAVKQDIAAMRTGAADARAFGKEIQALAKDLGLGERDARQLRTYRAGVADFTAQIAKLDAEMGPLAADIDALRAGGRAVPADVDMKYRDLSLKRDDAAGLLTFNRERAAEIEARGRKATDYMSPIREYAARLAARDKFDRDSAAFYKGLDAATAEEARPMVKGLVQAFSRGLLSPLAGGGTTASFARLRRDQMSVDDSFPARLSELGRTLTAKFVNPVDKFRDAVADLSTLKDVGRIDPDTYALAVADLVQGLGADIGPPQLAAGVEMGSQQLATMVAQAGVGSGPKTVEGLLAAIKLVNEQQLAAAKQMVVGIDRKPPLVTAPE
jgi:tape measure domain-containing protein